VEQDNGRDRPTKSPGKGARPGARHTGDKPRPGNRHKQGDRTGPPRARDGAEAGKRTGGPAGGPGKAKPKAKGGPKRDHDARPKSKGRPHGGQQRNRSGGDRRPRSPQASANRPRPSQERPAQPSGLTTRHLALLTTEAVIRDRISLDRALPQLLAGGHFAGLDARDKAFARLLAMTVLRRHADLDRIVNRFLEKPLTDDAVRIRLILLAGAAELAILTVPPHAAISNAVELTRLSPKTAHFDRLANAILRRISEKGTALLAETADPASNIPAWMIDGWRAAYGEETAGRIAAASLTEAALDITLKDPAAADRWAGELASIILPTGTLRRASGGRIEDLPGYAAGEWWVQDAAASLPTRLIGAKSGDSVLDLCAAPGGKTAQLASLGAEVTALDVSLDRLERLRANLERLRLEARTVASDATTWRSGMLFDHILIDAPCSATGTIRRHPDILHLKRADDTRHLTAVQDRLLRNAATQLRVGGTLLYCTCSLEPAECEERIEAFLANPGASYVSFARRPIEPSEIGGQSGWITASGDMRTFPFDLARDEPGLGGIDGFYAARLVRTG
jgi:16S rRNA (cytosine967-C5)-methyltransferase